MQREGSAFSGLGVVVLKELSDHLTGIRMIVLEWLVVLMALGVVYTGIQQIREVSAERSVSILASFHASGRRFAFIRFRVVFPRSARGHRDRLRFGQ